ASPRETRTPTSPRSRLGELLDTAVALKRVVYMRSAVVDTALLGADQRFDDAGAGDHAIGANQNFALCVVDRAHSESRAVVLGCKADRDGRVRRHRRGEQRGREYPDRER